MYKETLAIISFVYSTQIFDFDLGGAKILKNSSFKPTRINGGHDGLPGQQWSNSNKNEDAVIFGTTRHRGIDQSNII